jgi:hypothetical protein
VRSKPQLRGEAFAGLEGVHRFDDGVEDVPHRVSLSLKEYRSLVRGEVVAELFPRVPAQVADLAALDLHAGVERSGYRRSVRLDDVLQSHASTLQAACCTVRVQWSRRESCVAENDPVFARWFGYSAGLAGSLVGVTAESLVPGGGGAVVGAIVGESLEHVLSEVGGRLLSDREKQRVGAVAILARRSLIAYLGDGARLRGDDLLRARADGRTPAEEIVEHVFQIAQRSFEERKLPHVAAVLATIAVNDWIDEGTAHWLLSMVEQLSWPKLVALALVAENEQAPLPDRKVGEDLGGWGPWALHHVFTELQYSDHCIIRKPRRSPTGTPDFDTYLSDARLSSGGRLIHFAADLDTIGPDDLRHMREAIEANS